MVARVFQLMNQQFPLPSDSEFDERSTAESDVLLAMDNFIHRTEVQAYASLLCAFIYNTNNLNKENQNLIISLIKELKISNDDHNEVLGEIKNDEMVHLVNSIREWKYFDNFSSERGIKSPFPAVSASQQDQPLSNLSSVKYVQDPSMEPTKPASLPLCFNLKPIRISNLYVDKEELNKMRV